MSVPLTPSADKNWIIARWACLEESMAQSLTVISLLFQSTTHCRYRVYTKFLLTYTVIYRRNRKVLPLGITALQPQSRFHMGTPYTFDLKDRVDAEPEKCIIRTNCYIFLYPHHKLSSVWHKCKPRILNSWGFIQWGIFKLSVHKMITKPTSRNIWRNLLESQR